MIKSVGRSVHFGADNKTLNKNGEYKDPLMRWPLRAASYSNEVGEALRPVIGHTAATMSWIPALMYIGADVYDKYKNDQTEYSPNSKRCLQQAVFQGAASVLLPSIAVKTGQNAFSQFGKLTKDGISLNHKEQVSQMAEAFIANGKMRFYDGKDEECVADFVSSVANKVEYKKHTESAKNPIQKVWHKIEDGVGTFFETNRKEKIKDYSKKTINDLIDLRKRLIQPDEATKMSKWYKNFMQNIADGQTQSVAVKNTLTQFQQSRVLKSKAVKTVGGFVALGLAIKPIDKFVEHVLIEKIVSPGLNKIGGNKKQG